MIPEKVIHFLVVDDDRDARAMVVEYLNALGFDKITQARDGADAIRQLDRDPSINFIISDWDMPLMNGLTFLQRVKSHPTRSQTPFLIITNPIGEEAEKIVLAAESSVDGYLIKPFRSVTLKEKIDKVLSMPARGQNKIAMVVDDDLDAREMLIEYLRGMGFKEVVGFENGRTGLQYLTQNFGKVGLLVSDWEMPEMNGIELLRACKSAPTLEPIPFLMITSQTSIERMKVMQAAKAQVDQYLLKPFSGDELRKRIDLLLGRARTRGEVHAITAEAVDHVEHGRYQRAQTRFEDALNLDPSFDVALRGLGDVLMKIKGAASALPFYKRAVESNPFNPKGYIKLSAAYEMTGLLDKALALLQTANQQISFSAELHFHLGRIYNKKGLGPLAKAEFEKTLEIQLDHQEARLMLGMLANSSEAKS